MSAVLAVCLEVLREFVARTSSCGSTPTADEQSEWKRLASYFVRKAFEAAEVDDDATISMRSKVERVKSYQQLHAEDWQLQAVGLPGYSLFMPSEGDGAVPIHERPALILNRDQHACNMSAYAYMMYKRSARLMPVWDPMHRTSGGVCVVYFVCFESFIYFLCFVC